MISFFQAVVLGFLQGLSELFPVSSLGHSVIFPQLVGWNIDQTSAFFVNFLVATHAATALVLFVFFWSDWRRIFAGLWRSVVARGLRADNLDGRLGWLLIVGTIPAGIIGLLFENTLKQAFAAPLLAALFLIVNGLILYLGERKRRTLPASTARTQTDAAAPIARLSWWQAIKVGTAQVLALIPGISRSGTTMTAGLLVGLSNEEAARFSFLLATPIIGAAALLKIPKLLAGDSTSLTIALVGGISAAIGAILAVQFLMRFFRTEKLTPFAIYCVVAGIVFAGILWSRGLGL